MPNIHGWICAVVSRFTFAIKQNTFVNVYQKFDNSTTASQYGKPLLPKAIRVLNLGPTGFKPWQVANLKW